MLYLLSPGNVNLYGSPVWGKTVLGKVRSGSEADISQ